MNLARKNLAAFSLGCDAVISNAAGCSSGLREYPLLLAGEPEEALTHEFAARVKDISVVLHELGLIPIQREPTLISRRLSPRARTGGYPSSLNPC